MDSGKGCYLQRVDADKSVKRVWAVLNATSLSLYTKKNQTSADHICTLDVSGGSVNRSSGTFTMRWMYEAKLNI